MHAQAMAFNRAETARQHFTALRTMQQQYMRNRFQVRASEEAIGFWMHIHDEPCDVRRNCAECIGAAPP